MDLESESQKECQDILDSIDDLINFEDLKEESYPSNQNHSPNASSEKMIPQVDGAGDDIPLTPCAGTTGNSSEMELETKFGRTSGHRLSKDAGTSFNHKRKRKKVLWGSLPLSAQELMNDREAVSFCGDTKDVVSRSSFSEKAVGKDEDASMKDANTDVCDIKDTTTLIGCSVRDLMRRKRFYKVEAVECGSQGVNNDILEGEQKEDVNICPRHLDFKRLHVGELDGRTNESFDNSLSLSDKQFVVKTDLGCAPCGKFECLSSSGNSLDASALGNGKFNSFMSNNDDGIRDITQSWLSTSSCLQSAMEFEMSCKDGDIKSSLEGQPSRGWIHELSTEKPAGINATAEMIVFNDGQSQGGEASMVCKSDTEDKNLIMLAFCKEPPIADWTDRTSEISVGHTSSGFYNFVFDFWFWQ